MKLLLIAPRGFCAGVTMATDSLNRALQIYGPPVIVYHEIVHNKSVVRDFERRGVVFIDDIDEAPVGSCVMFSAHGVSPAVRQRARQRQLITIDATCPLVRKVHDEVVRFANRDYTVFLIGHAGHDEVVGTLGLSPNVQLVQTDADVDRVTAADPKRTAFVMQTTLSVDDASRIAELLRERFPDIESPATDDICYATQNRQRAVRQFSVLADIVLVVGSRTSSNSTRLAEVAGDLGKPSFLVDGADDIRTEWFEGRETVLITAGASAPEERVQQCVRWLRHHYDAELEELSAGVELVQFPLPEPLRRVEPVTLRRAVPDGRG